MKDHWCPVCSESVVVLSPPDTLEYLCFLSIPLSPKTSSGSRTSAPSLGKRSCGCIFCSSQRSQWWYTCYTSIRSLSSPPPSLLCCYEFLGQKQTAAYHPLCWKVDRLQPSCSSSNSDSRRIAQFLFRICVWIMHFLPDILCSAYFLFLNCILFSLEGARCKLWHY